VIKGPAGSLYGAGTGGAILINSNVANPEPGLLVICLMAVMIIVMQMFSLTRAKVTSEILLLIRTSKVMVTEIIHQCEEMLLPGELRSAQVKRNIAFQFSLW
jgi:hypothetical protein